MLNTDDEQKYAYLLDPAFELVNSNGKPLTGGYIEVYLHGTRDKYYCCSDFDGTLHPFQIPLDSLGSNIILASPAHAYDLYVYNKFGSLVMSRYNIVPATADPTSIESTNITSNDNTVTVTAAATDFDLSIADTVDPIIQDIVSINSDINSISNRITQVESGLANKKDIQLPVKYASDNTRTITELQQDENGKIVYVKYSDIDRTGLKTVQETLTFNGDTTKTITNITQMPNGNIAVTFEDIDLPQEVPNIEIESSTLEVSSDIDPDTNTKTFTIDVKQGDVNWINARSAGTDMGIDANTTITGYTKKDGTIDIVPQYNLLPLKNEVPYLVIEELTLKTVEPAVDKCSEVQVHLFNEGISGVHAGDIVAYVRLDNSNAYTQTITVGGILYGGKTGRTSDNYGGGIYASVMNKFTGSAIEGTIKATVNNISVYELTSIMGQGGGGGTEYTAGDAIDISNDTISVKYAEGLELNADNALKVKLGKGLKFDTDAGVEGEISIDDIGQEVIDQVLELASELDKKITTTFNYAQITSMQDFAPFGVQGTTRLIGQLFAVPIASELRIDDTLISVRALQQYNGKVSFGIFEFDFDGNEGSGSTTWLCDTGVVSVKAGENQFPIKNMIPTSTVRPTIKMEPGKLYYATILVANDAPATGLYLASCDAYEANYNATPKYTMVASNMDTYVDWTNGSQRNTWFQGYNEFHEIPRLFMMIRNGDAVPVPVIDPFVNYSSFTLEHQYRLSDLFSLTFTVSNQPVIYQKIRPNQDCIITKIGWVDYHAGATYDYGTDIPLMIDGNYTSMTKFGDNVESSSGTKIDDVHYYHEYTLNNPISLQADTNYFVPCNMKISGTDEWIITYSSPTGTSKDLILFDSKYNVASWAGNHAEYLSSQPGTFCRIFTDDGNTYTF